MKIISRRLVLQLSIHVRRKSKLRSQSAHFADTTTKRRSHSTIKVSCKQLLYGDFRSTTQTISLFQWLEFESARWHYEKKNFDHRNFTKMAKSCLEDARLLGRSSRQRRQHAERTESVRVSAVYILGRKAKCAVQSYQTNKIRKKKQTQVITRMDRQRLALRELYSKREREKN